MAFIVKIMHENVDIALPNVPSALFVNNLLVAASL